MVGDERIDARGVQQLPQHLLSQSFGHDIPLLIRLRPSSMVPAPKIEPVHRSYRLATAKSASSWVNFSPYSETSWSRTASGDMLIIS